MSAAGRPGWCLSSLGHLVGRLVPGTVWRLTLFFCSRQCFWQISSPPSSSNCWLLLVCICCPTGLSGGGARKGRWDLKSGEARRAKEVAGGLGSCGQKLTFLFPPNLSPSAPGFSSVGFVPLEASSWLPSLIQWGPACVVSVRFCVRWGTQRNRNGVLGSLPN